MSDQISVSELLGRSLPNHLIPSEFDEALCDNERSYPHFSVNHFLQEAAQ